MKSNAARLLAVRQEMRQSGEREPATVDGIHPRRWQTRARALSGRDERRQKALVKMALEPAWEARFEPGSYGFRPGRSCRDALRAIREDLCGRSTYVLVADLQGCLATIDQEALLQKLDALPAVRRVVKAWLAAGLMGTAAPSEASRREELALFLVNVALHGLATHLEQTCQSEGAKARVVRYADAFVVLHPTPGGLLKARAIAQSWLGKLGLELHPDRTRIAHTLKPYQGNVGFDFLGWTVRQWPVGKNRRGGGKGERLPGLTTRLRPGRESIRQHMEEIKRVINENVAASQETLIRKLNPIVWSWADYYRTPGTTRDLAVCDHHLWWLLWRWARRRHPHKGQGWLKERYWHSAQNRQRVFGTGNGTTLCLHSQTGNWRLARVADSPSKEKSFPRAEI